MFLNGTENCECEQPQNLTEEKPVESKEVVLQDILTIGSLFSLLFNIFR